MTKTIKTKEIKTLALVLVILLALWAIDTSQNNILTGYEVSMGEIDYSIPGFVLERGWNLIGVSRDMIGKTTSDLSGKCDIRYAFAYDDTANLHLMTTPTRAAPIVKTLEGNAMWLHTQNKCRYNPEAKTVTSTRTQERVTAGQLSTTAITREVTGKKLSEVKIRGRNIEKAWVYQPSGATPEQDEAESYVGWTRLLPNDKIVEAYIGKGMVIKADTGSIDYMPLPESYFKVPLGNFNKEIAQKYFSSHEDVDVLFVIAPSKRVQNLHYSIKPPFALPEDYGSGGKLMAVIFLNYRDEFYALDKAIAHEFGHWRPNIHNGMISYSGHYTSCFGQNVPDALGYFWKDNSDGTFKLVLNNGPGTMPWRGNKQYGSLTLFLMGLIDEKEFTGVFLIKPEKSGECAPEEPTEEVLVRGKRVDITAEDVLSLALKNGIQLPAFPGKTTYSAGLIVAQPEGESPYDGAEGLTKLISNTINAASGGRVYVQFD